MFNIVLLEPEIPANTGNIGRTCLCTGSRLHLIEPLGFLINDKNLKRAGMDYWYKLDVTTYTSWNDFVRKNADVINFPEAILTAAGCGNTIIKAGSGGKDEGGKVSCQGLTAASPEQETADETEAGSVNKADLWMATTKARATHDQAAFKDGDFIMFGKESGGIPEEILMESPDTCVRIPMAKELRSLNLSNSVAVVLYEALRQNNYLDLETEGNLHHHEW